MDCEKQGVIFSDETALFRAPIEPDPGDEVHVRLRVKKGYAGRCEIFADMIGRPIPMTCIESDECFDMFEGSFVCTNRETAYVFIVETKEGRICYSKNGTKPIEGEPVIDKAVAFRFTPGFHVPEWSKGAVQYQIFVDRFFNGNTNADVDNGEYYYIDGPAEALSWDEPINDHDYRSFRGGDLQGVMKQLDYLQQLGIDAIYLNPIFVSPSSHKYDTQDYDHIDPHFGIIVLDEKFKIEPENTNNRFARQYIRRVTSPENLDASDAYFAQLCNEIHSRGMRIILDGVFNHCGSFNKWMDREGIYRGRVGFSEGAFQSIGSPYRAYFKYRQSESGRPPEYEGWWGHNTLPKLNYEGAPKLREEIMRAAEKWASPPYSIDGWRLDVAADLGHTLQYNHDFWREFRKRVKAINPDIVIIAEHYGDASEWLRGDQWDTVMNYDAFMDPVSFFLTGMEKHSDYCIPELWQNGDAFFDSMRKNMAAMQGPSLYCAMNELSNHDHSRFLTRTNRSVGRLHTAGSTAAGNGIEPAVLREAVVMQMTWPGAPTIYYGDEAGQVGWTDPDNRRTYPWGREDKELMNLHHDLIALRKTYRVFAEGSVLPLLADIGTIAYARFDRDTCVIVIVNNNSGAKPVTIDTKTIGICEGSLQRLFYCGREGHICETGVSIPVISSRFKIEMDPQSAVILMCRYK